MEAIETPADDANPDAGVVGLATPPQEEAPPSERTDERDAPATATGGEVLVEVRDLVKHYGPIRAVDGISFTVRRGEVLGFLGPNGAGKTTAMRLITGFLEPDAGEVRVAGHRLDGDSLAARQRIGYLPENAPAYGEMTVDGFLAFIAEARGVAAIEPAIRRVVEMTGLAQVLHQTIDTLSKGFKRRVGLAQALIHDPEVLILDEPTDGLDPNQKAMVQKLISNLSGDKCIILSTHILDEVEKVCNRAMIIHRGRIVVDSTPEELIARAPNHNVVRLTLQAPRPELLETLRRQPWCDRLAPRSSTVVDVYPLHGGNHLSEILDLVPDSALQSVHLEEGRLDDLFRQLTEGVTA